MVSVWPAIIWIVLQTISMGYQISKGASQFVGSLVTGALGGGLLWWGNFFAPLVR